jgi:Tfp pilus assembly protein PilN
VNSHPLLALLIPTLVAVVSWFVGSWLAVRRDRANKRRDLRVQYLIEAYRRLEAAGHRSLVPPYSSDMESAIADIQLFGSSVQVAAAQKFAFEMAQQRQASTDELLDSLRTELREELELEHIDGKLAFFRIVFDKDKKK